MAIEYVWTMTAQAWRKDSFYASSNEPVYDLVIVAPSEAVAKDRAREALDAIKSDWYWKFRVKSMRDLRASEPSR